MAVEGRPVQRGSVLFGRNGMLVHRGREGGGKAAAGQQEVGYADGIHVGGIFIRELRRDGEEVQHVS